MQFGEKFERKRKKILFLIKIEAVTLKGNLLEI